MPSLLVYPGLPAAHLAPVRRGEAPRSGAEGSSIRLLRSRSSAPWRHLLPGVWGEGTPVDAATIRRSAQRKWLRSARNIGFDCSKVSGAILINVSILGVNPLSVQSERCRPSAYLFEYEPPPSCSIGEIERSRGHSISKNPRNPENLIRAITRTFQSWEWVEPPHDPGTPISWLALFPDPKLANLEIGVPSNLIPRRFDTFDEFAIRSRKRAHPSMAHATASAFRAVHPGL